MKIKNIINKVNKSNPNEVDISHIVDIIFGIYLDYQPSEDLVSYWVKPHYCTDTWVGIKIYFLKDKAIMLSKQEGRKCDEEFTFLYENAKDDLFNFIKSFIRYDATTDDYISGVLEEEISDYFSIDYSEQVLYHYYPHALYKEEKCKIIPFRDREHRNKCNGLIIIEYCSKEILVPLQEVKFPIWCGGL
jgi:hypothetical protein